jgi:hypothetical protein
MSSPRITSRRAVHALRSLLDDDIVSVAVDEHAAGESADVEALIEQAEREWATAERSETARVSRRFTDQPRARRAHRRADRTVLRMLPDRLRPVAAVEGAA